MPHYILPILKLPAELRIHFYACYALCFNRALIWVGNRPDLSYRFAPTLLCANRQIYREALYIFYENCDFWLHAAPSNVTAYGLVRGTLRAFLGTIPECTMGRIHRARLGFPTGGNLMESSQSSLLTSSVIDLMRQNFKSLVRVTLHADETELDRLLEYDRRNPAGLEATLAHIQRRLTSIHSLLETTVEIRSSRKRRVAPERLDKIGWARQKFGHTCGWAFRVNTNPNMDYRDDEVPSTSPEQGTRLPIRSSRFDMVFQRDVYFNNSFRSVPHHLDLDSDPDNLEADISWKDELDGDDSCHKYVRNYAA